jgi:hypothetical protein
VLLIVALATVFFLIAGFFVLMMILWFSAYSG